MSNLLKACARNVAEPVVDMLFPKGSTGRIPIIAITGQMVKQLPPGLQRIFAKLPVIKLAYTTSDGVYIQNQLMMKGDCTGPGSAEFVLKDPLLILQYWNVQEADFKKRACISKL